MATVALAGAGRMAAVHALAVGAARPTGSLTITRVAAPRPEQAAALAEQLRAAPCAPADLPAGADLVVVATPTASHAHVAVQSVQAGASALVELPLAATLDDADRLVEAAEAGGRIGYAENLAHAPIVRRAQARIGELGPLHHLSVRVLEGPPDRWATAGVAPPSTPTPGTDPDGSPVGTRTGGALAESGAHALAVLLLLAAPARPVSVSARLEPAPTPTPTPTPTAPAAAPGGDPAPVVDEHAELTIELDTGLRVQLTVSWRHPDTGVWDLQAASETGVLRLELHPNFGLEVDGEPVPLPALRSDLPSPQLERMGYLGQIEALAADLTAGRAPEVGAAFGRSVLELTCAAYASAHDGRRCPLPFRGRRDRTPLELWQHGG